MSDAGFKGWWHAYFAYRFAPMGPVPASVVVSAAYGFAPRFVERAVPGVWSVLPPAEVLRVHRTLVSDALRRVFTDDLFAPDLAEAAELSRESVAELDAGARPLFAAHQDLPWPEHPAEVLVHACTLLREHRGDSHNIALAAAGVSGVQSHVVVPARAPVNQATIENIRGWSAAEWDVAVEQLQARGWVDPAGAVTDAGRAARADIETATDELAARPVRQLGPDRTARLIELLKPIAEHLTSTGEIPGAWPPPAVQRV